ncbi:MAG: ABC transporter substrate-binding protein, partial [Pygmaiobacter sp.]
MKKRKLRALCVVLCCALALTSCGASSPTSEGLPPPKEQNNASNAQNELRLAYSKEDGFNPYRSTSTLVLQCAQLLFDSLVVIRDDFELDYHLARLVSTSGTTAVITLGSGSFADGTPITAADVAASIEAARASALYGGRFAQVVSVKPSDSIVTVELSQPDSLFAYLLDIPILKASETALPSPTASGRYSVHESETGASLVANSTFADQTELDSITLVPITAHDALVAGLNMGTVSLYASEQDEDLAGNNICNTAYYNLNNLVFIGVNAQNGVLAQPAVRTALSAALSRRQLVDKVYYSRAYVATNLANSRYPFLSGEHTIAADANPAAVALQLEALGYVRSSETGFYRDASGRELSFELLCYSGNTFKRYLASLVQEQLAECGVRITLAEESDFNLYREKIASGQFSLYIGEVKLYNNINLDPFFSQNGNAHYGI